MRTASYILLALGLCAAAVCFFGLSAESLPFQDPSAEMLYAQARRVRWWQAGLLASLFIAGVAVVSAWRTRRPRGAA